MTHPIKVNECRWIIPTFCNECFIDVCHSSVDDVKDNWKWISIGLLHNHDGWWDGRLRHRIANAWRILSGRPHTFFELWTIEETDGLIQALTIARSAAFGELAQSQDQVKPQEAQGEEEEPSRQQGDAPNITHPDCAESEQDHRHQ